MKPGIVMQHDEQGFALVAALFLLVVVAALGVFAMRSNIAQQDSINTDLRFLRADASARSGLEYGSARAISGACPGVSAPTALVIEGFNVSVTCEDVGHQTFVLTAQAQAGSYGTADFVRRTLTRNVRLGSIG